MSDHVHDGPVSTTHRYITDGNFTTIGTLDGVGTATFGSLHSRVEIGGPAALHGWGKSTFNDHWTVTNPALTGTQGTMQLGFDLSGTTAALDGNGNPVEGGPWAQASLIVDINPTSITSGTRVLAFDTPLPDGPTQIVATPGGPTVTAAFNFTYGVPFGVRAGLALYAETDSFFQGSTFTPSYFEWYGGARSVQLRSIF